MEQQAAKNDVPEVVVCGTLVADVRVRPFRPLRPRDGVTVRRVDSIKLMAGGVVANTGLALARLGRKTAAVGRLGADAMGSAVLEALQRGGVDTAGIRRMADVPTASVIVCIDEQGERTFHIAEGANTLFGVDDLEQNMAALRGARAAVIGYLGELPYLDPYLPALLARLKRETGATLLLETAGPQVAMRETLDACLPHVDLFLPSWEEARDLTGARTPEAALRDLAQAASRTVLGIKLGARGCLVRDGQRIYRVPAYPATVVDATGAGDAFLAGFLTGWLSGYDVQVAARLGNMAGALTVGAEDGQAALPPFERLVELVEQMERRGEDER